MSDASQEGRLPVSRPSVALLGLGAMGLPMARNLAAAGPLTVWNRTPRAETDVPGARVAETPTDAVADVVITVLPDIVDVRDVLEGERGLLAGSASREDPVLVVVCGTVSPAAVRALAAEVAGHGVELIDAPLSGGVQGAAEGRLSVMVGASEEQFFALRAVLEPCAGSILRMGEVGAGAMAKLCNQIVVAETVTALSEAFALARATGIDPAALADVLGGGLAASEVLRQKRHHWIDRSFVPGGTVDYQVKDLRYALAEATGTGLRLDGLRTALETFERSAAEGDGGLDHTGVYRVIARRD
ncbi:MAG: NAD(P)-dependent oxidoreductase [Microbacterium sp.]